MFVFVLFQGALPPARGVRGRGYGVTYFLQGVSSTSTQGEGETRTDCFHILETGRRDDREADEKDIRLRVG